MTNHAVLTPLIRRVHTGYCWIKKPGEHPGRRNIPLTDDVIEGHLASRYSIGACPISPGTSATRVALLDMDSHKGDVPWEKMLDQARVIIDALEELGLHAIPFRSSGGSGIHLYLLWKEPQDAYSVREALKITLAKCGFQSGTKGIAENEIEIFPKQNAVPADGYGSMFILPLSMKSCALLNDGTLRDTVPGNINWKGSDDVERREKPVVGREPRNNLRAVGSAGSPELEKLKSALDTIPNTGANELGYDAWRNIIFAIHHATDGDDCGLDLAHEFSSRASVYDADFLDTRVWPYIRSDRPDGVTARTVFAMASRYGWMDPSLADEFEVTVPDPNDVKHRDPFSQTDTTGADGEQGSGTTRFQVIPADEFVGGKSPPWIVKGVLPQAALAVIFGESTSGKTFFALDLVCAVARGVSWRGHTVQQGAAVYVCAEGISGFRNRVRAYRTDLMAADDTLPVGVIADAPNFLETDDIKAVIAAVIAYRKTVGRIAVIVIDTLARALVGGDENSAQDMGKAVYHAEQLHRVTGATVVFIHHSGKDSSKGARGSNSLRAAADCEIEISRSDDDREAVITKLKDGEDGQRYPFKLRSVPLADLDDDGEVITSCVVEHAEGGSKAQGKAPPKPREKMAEVLAVAKDMAGRPADFELTPAALLTEAKRRETENAPPGLRVNLNNIDRAVTSLFGTPGKPAWLKMNDDGRTFSIFGHESGDDLA